MKLKMHSFDFENNTITFSVPPEVMRSNRWGNVPEGVDVDLAPITGNNSLGLNYYSQKVQDTIDEYYKEQA